MTVASVNSSYHPAIGGDRDAAQPETNSNSIKGDELLELIKNFHFLCFAWPDIIRAAYATPNRSRIRPSKFVSLIDAIDPVLCPTMG